MQRSLSRDVPGDKDRGRFGRQSAGRTGFSVWASDATTPSVNGPITASSRSRTVKRDSISGCQASRAPSPWQPASEGLSVPYADWDVGVGSGADGGQFVGRAAGEL
jgi:hypothetical protein